jgi:hypothetical protein
MTLRTRDSDAIRMASAAILAVGGLVVVAWPVSPYSALTVPSHAIALPPAKAAVTLPSDSADIATILRANVFSDARRPVPTSGRPGAAASGMTAATGTTANIVRPATDDSTPPAPRSAGGPRLYGIIPGADGPIALLRLDSPGTAALPYHVGDRAGRYRVVSIGDRDVVIDGPAGRRTLRMFAAPIAPTPR